MEYFNVITLETHIQTTVYLNISTHPPIHTPDQACGLFRVRRQKLA